MTSENTLVPCLRWRETWSQCSKESGMTSPLFRLHSLDMDSLLNFFVFFICTSCMLDPSDAFSTILFYFYRVIKQVVQSKYPEAYEGQSKLLSYWITFSDITALFSRSCWSDICDWDNLPLFSFFLQHVKWSMFLLMMMMMMKRRKRWQHLKCQTITQPTVQNQITQIKAKSIVLWSYRLLFVR